ncbi:adenosylcobinamide-phosphate synthase [Nakamurella sp. UYEF19]|uniref:cobalamin biosynthesis protein n=1 Tax=Nakamurella sp. UYEF19 TaxID=1756392 RepID=UPI003393F8E9
MTSTARGAGRAIGLLVGVAADRLLGDPARWHPVAGFGSSAAAVQRLVYRDRRWAGVGHVGLLVGGTTLLGMVVEKCSATTPIRILATAAATFVVLGGRSLEREARTISAQLLAGDLAAAREQVTHLVGRDTSELDAAEITRATIESVAENTADAVVSPLLWGAVAGVPGLLAYRAANTLDAMIGHRSPRYLRFGWAAARLDDLANFVPARVSVVLIAVCAPVVAGPPRAAVAAARRDGPGHPSPNAGPVEAAFAGALGRTLGGVNVYRGQVEDRGTLGDGPPPDVADIARVARLSAAVSGMSAVVAAVVALVLGRRR